MTILTISAANSLTHQIQVQWNQLLKVKCLNRSSKSNSPSNVKTDVTGCQRALFEWADSYDTKVRRINVSKDFIT
jgi:hypothetical protein